MWSPSDMETYAFNAPVYSDSNSGMSYDDFVPSYTVLGAAPSQHAGNSPDSGFEDNSPSSSPVLEIEEQPETSYRFRYLKESVKPHGPLKGEFSEGKTPKNSSGPKVKLNNFRGEAVIRIWLWEGTEKGGPSPHRLLSSKNKDDIKDEPHHLVLNAQNNYTACFDKLNIVHVVQSEKEYQRCYLRKKAGVAARFGERFVQDLPDAPHSFNEKHVKAEWKNKDKDICSLYFEAFEKRGSDYFYIANAISRSIRNKKSPKTNDLKIVRLSHVEGSVNGGDTVMIFTEKLVKDIRIPFTDDDGWEADAIFEEKDIHKQVAVAFKTPPYKDVNISEPVTVYFHIERTAPVPAQSESVMFRYLPDPARCAVQDLPPPKRKRLLQEAPPLEMNRVFSDADTTVVNDADESHGDPTLGLEDPEILDELLQYQNIENEMDEFDEVSTSDLLLKDSLPRAALEAYYNCYKDSTPAARGVLDPNARLPLSVFEKARRLHSSILRDSAKDFAKYLSIETVNYKIGSQTPLHLAVKHERSEMINKLLGAKADLYALDGVKSNTPIHDAILNSYAALQILMSSPVPPSPVFNKDGDDPVLFGVRNMKLDSVKVLLKNKFSLETSNIKDGDGPLHVAVQIPDPQIRFDMVSLLLEHKATVSRRNGAGLTALDLAHSNPQPERLIEKLQLRLSEESDSEESENESDDDELNKKLNSLNLVEESAEESSRTDAIGNAAPEPYLALDGDVDTSKKVADLTQCAFLKPFLVGAQKQSQVLLKQLERKMSPAEAVKTLNDAYARAKGL